MSVTQIWIVRERYGFGVLGVFTSKERADAERAIYENHPDQWISGGSAVVDGPIASMPRSAWTPCAPI